MMPDNVLRIATRHRQKGQCPFRIKAGSRSASVVTFSELTVTF